MSFELGIYEYWAMRRTVELCRADVPDRRPLHITPVNCGVDRPLLFRIA